MGYDNFQNTPVLGLVWSGHGPKKSQFVIAYTKWANLGGSDLLRYYVEKSHSCYFGGQFTHIPLVIPHVKVEDVFNQVQELKAKIKV